MNETSTQQIWSLLEDVCDPEVPVLSILDLGIVRDVKVEEDNYVVSYLFPASSKYRF